MKRSLLILAVCMLLLAFYLVLKEAPPLPEGETPDLETTTEAPGEAADALPVMPPDARLERLPGGRVNFLPALEVSRRIGPQNPAAVNLAELESILVQYRFAFGENPVGVENFEITQQLLGNNPRRVVFIAQDSPALAGNELVDQWGTPYFFHAVSSQEMEIVSAGPDEKFWTDDDIASAPSDGAN